MTNKKVIGLDAVEEFFFKAMIRGWADNTETQIIPALPGYKAIEFRDGNLRLLDFYSKTTGSSKSAGTTIIFHKDVPVWIMQYSGAYEKEAIPFLKSILLDAYKNKQFFGGRGPAIHETETLAYFNIYPENAFFYFKGKEKIIKTIRESNRSVKIENLGTHKYFGMSLI